MAAAAASKPTLSLSPKRGATTVAAAIEIRSPRIVFDDPKMGRPSMNFLPPSTGRQRLLPKMRLAMTGEPFVSVNNVRIFAIPTKFMVSNLNRRCLEEVRPGCFLLSAGRSMDALGIVAFGLAKGE
jgi:hypothetical protein